MEISENVMAMLRQIQSIIGIGKKNLPPNTNAKAFHRWEAEQSRRSVLQAHGLDPDNETLTVDSVPKQFRRAVFYPDGDRVAKSQLEYDQMIASGGSAVPVPVTNEMSEVDRLKQELSEAKLALIHKNRKSA